MTIIIEIGRNLTFGLDWFQNIKGVRLGVIAIHFVPLTVPKFVELYSRVLSTPK